MSKLVLSLIVTALSALSPIYANYNSYIVKIKRNREAVIRSIESRDAEVRKAFDLNDRIIKNDSPQAAKLSSSLQNYYVATIGDGRSAESFIQALKLDPNVESVEPNYVLKIETLETPNDPMFNEQWNLKQIRAQRAWEISGGAGVVVGVVDTGIDFEHEDLKDQLWINSPEDLNGNGKFDPWPADTIFEGVSGDFDGIDNDGNGYVDDVIGFDFVDQTVMNLGDASFRDAVPTDETDHGTPVSGVIAARKNNDFGLVGVAPDARIMTLRAFDATGNGESDDVAAAIVYGALNGAGAINMSFGDFLRIPIIEDACKFAESLGCVLVASSGNNNMSRDHFPSDHPEVICVGAVREDEERYWRSNWGPYLDLVAPGYEVPAPSMGGGFKITSGTSLSAPHISGAVALILSLNSDLSPEQVRGILQTSAKEGGEEKWDMYYGAGILDCFAAVQTYGSTVIEIFEPIDKSVIDLDEESELVVEGRVLSPLFDSFSVELYRGELVEPQFLLAYEEANYSRVDSAVLARFNLEDLQPGTYVVSLKVDLKNGNFLRKNVKVNLASSETPNEILVLRSFPAWFNQERVVSTACATRQSTEFFVRFRPKGSSEDFTEIKDTEYNSQFHEIQIGHEAAPDVEMEAVAYAVRADGDTVTRAFEFVRPSEGWTSADFIGKNYSFPVSLINFGATDLYGEGRNSLALNDLTDLRLGKARVRKFENGEFKLADSAQNDRIPVDVGDANNNGIPDITTTYYGETAIYEGDFLGDNPFKKQIFLFGNWAGKTADANNDGEDEVLTFIYDRFYLHKFIDGEFRVVDSIVVEEATSRLGTKPGVEIADFDGDGANEVAFSSDPLGHIYVYEYSGGRFVREFIDTTDVSEGAQYTTVGDADADGIPEFGVMNFGSSEYFGDVGAGSTIWKTALLKSVGPNSYELVSIDRIYGVRYGTIDRLGITYRNGVAAGDLDGNPGDEFVFSAFPNLYAFEWDSNNDKLAPFWRYPNAWASGAIIEDFDGNGMPEIGFSTFSATRFFEYDGEGDRPRPPANLKAWATGETTARMEWNAVPEADFYVALERIERDGETKFDELGTTSDTFFEISNLENETWHRLYVAAIDESAETELSYVSDEAAVFTHALVEPLSAETDFGEFVEVEFSGKLPETPANPGHFRVYIDDYSNYVSPTTVLSDGANKARLVFGERLPTENYMIQVKSFRDYYYSPTVEKEIDLIVPGISDKPDEMILSRLEILTIYSVKIYFDREVESASASNSANYELRPLGDVVSATLDPVDATAVVLDFGKNQAIGALGRQYAITAKNIVSKEGVPITTGPGATLGFVFTPEKPDNAYVYPNPIRLSERPNVYFANLPVGSEVEIYSLNGVKLLSVYETGGDGGAEWDGRDDDGALLDPGIYVFKVLWREDGSLNESDPIKFAIIQ